MTTTFVKFVLLSLLPTTKPTLSINVRNEAVFEISNDFSKVNKHALNEESIELGKLLSRITFLQQRR